MLAAVTLFASCSQEEIVSKTDGESLVSFTVTTPELGSRAADGNYDGDGTKITKLYYAVYDETVGEIVPAISNTDKDDIEDIEDEDFTGGTTKLELPLLNGHKYSLIFWAQNSVCPYSINWTDKTIKLNETNLMSNQENYDAFYAYVEPFVVSGAKHDNVELKRPFAQLNIATTQRDLADVVEYYNLPAVSDTKIEVKAATSMSLVTGNVYDVKPLVYNLAPFGSLAPHADVFPAATESDVYQAISLNYLLVGADKELVDIKMSCNSGASLDREFKNVPVQRNYRTNIYGNLYTSPTDWTVIVKPGFDGDYEPADQLAAVFEKGGEVTLYTDVELKKFLTLGEGKNVTINLNGNTITGPITGTSEKPTSYLFYVDGGTLEIKGEGKIETKQAYYSIPVWVNEGTVNIYGGEFYNAGDGCDLIYASGNGIVNIYGGYFRATDREGNEDGTLNTNTALNKQDAARATAKINVYGGSFYKFDPANNLSEGPNTNFVAEDHTSVQVGDNYVVTKGTAVADYTGLAAAIESAQDGAIITLATNVDLKGAPLRFNKGKVITIDLNGNNITADIFTESNGTISAGTSDSYAFWVENGTLNIKGEGIVKTQACKYSMAVYATGGVVNISGGEFYNAGEGSDLIYASGTGEGDGAQGAIINISGGVFKANKKQAFVEGNNNEYSVLNIKDYYRGATVSGKVDVPATKYAQINVTGGSFYKFNPADNVSEGANTNFVSVGYVSKPSGDWYVVSK